MAVINLDNAWFDAVPTPGGDEWSNVTGLVLKRANNTYMLGRDFTSQRCGIVLGAANIILDLNGFTVTYDNVPETIVPNGEFELGSGTTVPDWDISEAPQGALAPRDTHQGWGDQLLKFPGLTNAHGTQVITSAPIPIQYPNWPYVATLTLMGGSYCTGDVKVIDSVTSAVLGTSPPLNAGKGISGIVKFTPLTANPVILKMQFLVNPHVPPALPYVLDLRVDRATLSHAYHCGVLVSRGSSGNVPPYPTLSALGKANYKLVATPTIRNGRIIQGTGRCYSAPAIQANSCTGLTIQDVETYVTGMDTVSIEASSTTSGITITGCTIRHDVIHITDRLRNYAAIRAGGPTNVLIQNNQILDSPQIGISGGDNGATFTWKVLDNVIRQRSLVTNSYGIVFTAQRNFEVARNTITGFGRGMDIDGFGDTDTLDGEIYENHIDIKERPEREYGDTGDARAMRMRRPWVNKGIHKRIYIHDNTFIARASTGFVKGAVGLKMNYGMDPVVTANCEIRLHNNRCVGIAETPDCNASGISFDSMPVDLNMDIRGNIFESNDNSIELMGRDGGGSQPVEDVDLRLNTLAKSAEGDQTRAYRAVQCGWWTRPVRDIRLLGTQVSGGATIDLSWEGVGEKSIGTGWLLTPMVTASGIPLAGATATLRDRAGTVVSTGTTDVAGAVVLDVVTVWHTGATPAVRVADDRRPHALTVSHPDHTDAVINGLALAENTTLPVSLTGAPPASVIQFQTADVSATAVGPKTITVTRTGAAVGASTIHYSVSGGTAIAGTHYTATSGTLTFADGEVSKTFNVTVLALPAAGSGNKSVGLFLDTPGGADLGSPDTATFTLVDPGAPPPETVDYYMMLLDAGGFVVLKRVV